MKGEETTIMFIAETAWVGDSARVGGSAWVGDSAWVGGSAVVEGSAWVGDSARVGGSARVGDSAWVDGRMLINNTYPHASGYLLGFNWTYAYDTQDGWVLRFGCERHPVKGWPHTRLAKIHKPDEARKYAAATRALADMLQKTVKKVR